MKKKLNQIKAWLDDRGGFSKLIKPLTTHLVPPNAKWNYVWGSATLFCLILQVVTGIALAFLYQPSAGVAYQSLQYIENQAFLGSFIRGLHNWGASAMIFLLGIHMVRVYLNAAYKYPREMNWITGVILLACTIFLAFTGQLLRWDNNGVWSAVVASEQLGRIPIVGSSLAYFLLGGHTVSGETLNRFFAFHVFIFPAIILSVVAYHVYLVFHNGISEPPKAGRWLNPKTYRKWYANLLQKKGVPFFPDVIWRDVVFSAGVLVILLLLAYFIGAPELTKAPDLTDLKANPKPDWYFTWIFAIFALIPKELGSYIIFLGPVLTAAFLLSIPFLSKGGERSPIKRPWAIAGVGFVVLSIASLWYIGVKEPWSPRFKAKKLTESNYTHIKNTNTKRIAHGVELFNSEGCIYCHKINHKGGIRGPDLTDIENRLTKQQMIIRIVNGARNMPAYGGSLSDKEINDIVTFLGSDKPEIPKRDVPDKSKKEN